MWCSPDLGSGCTPRLIGVAVTPKVFVHILGVHLDLGLLLDLDIRWWLWPRVLLPASAGAPTVTLP